jgi:hypothetical protein
MREIRPSGSEGGARSIPCPYPYPNPTSEFGLNGNRNSDCQSAGDVTLMKLFMLFTEYQDLALSLFSV